MKNPKQDKTSFPVRIFSRIYQKVNWSARKIFWGVDIGKKRRIISLVALERAKSSRENERPRSKTPAEIKKIFYR